MKILGIWLVTSPPMLPTVASLSRLRSAAVADTAPRVVHALGKCWKEGTTVRALIYRVCFCALSLNEFDTRTKMAGSGNSDAGCCSVLKKLGLQPVTRCSLAKFYMPAFGAASYIAMSVNVMNPSLVIK